MGQAEPVNQGHRSYDQKDTFVQSNSQFFNNDLEKQIQHPNIGFFADFTRVPKQITIQIDCLLLEDDLKVIIQWSCENDLKLHEDEVQLISNGVI